jgi:acetylornithine deacetylase
MRFQLKTLPGFKTGPMSYGTDIAFLPQGTKGTFLLGPGSILVAHRPDEYVSKDDLLTATELYTRLVSELLDQRK